MMKVTAKAVRDGGWWVVEVPEVDGAFTQARRLDQIPAMVADAVGLLEDVPAEDVEVDLDVDLGDPAVLEEVRRLVCRSRRRPGLRRRRRVCRVRRWRICVMV